MLTDWGGLTLLHQEVKLNTTRPAFEPAAVTRWRWRRRPQDKFAAQHEVKTWTCAADHQPQRAAKSSMTCDITCAEVDILWMERFWLFCATLQSWRIQRSFYEFDWALLIAFWCHPEFLRAKTAPTSNTDKRSLEWLQCKCSGASQTTSDAFPVENSLLKVIVPRRVDSFVCAGEPTEYLLGSHKGFARRGRHSERKIHFVSLLACLNKSLKTIHQTDTLSHSRKVPSSQKLLAVDATGREHSLSSCNLKKHVGKTIATWDSAGQLELFFFFFVYSIIVKIWMLCSFLLRPALQLKTF